MPLEKKGMAKKEKFKIEDLPESTRKKIFVLSVVILSLVVISLWFFSFTSTIKRPENPEQKSSQDAEEIKKDISNLIDYTKSGVSDIKEKISELSNPQKEAEISEAELELLKDKIIASQIEKWQIYSNKDFGFEIKYPENFTVAEGENLNDSLILQLYYAARPDNKLAIERYESTDNFLEKTEIKKILKKESYYLAISDFINNTTTGLIIETFKLIE